MRTIGVAKLKAHLSAELRRVRAGETITVVDHNTPVARLAPISPELAVYKPATAAPSFRPLPPLVSSDVLALLEEERGEPW